MHIQALNLDAWAEIQLLNHINLFAGLFLTAFEPQQPGCSQFHPVARETVEAEYTCHPHLDCWPEHYCTRSLQAQSLFWAELAVWNFLRKGKQGSIHCPLRAVCSLASRLRETIPLASARLVNVSRQYTSDDGHLPASHSLSHQPDK